MAARSLIPKSAAPIWFWSAREAVEHRRVESALAEGGRLQRQLEDENAYLREQADTALAFGRVVGNSPALRRLLPQVELVAPTDATVLVLGESGSGKELFAREIHQRSRRAQRPLITGNCSTKCSRASSSGTSAGGRIPKSHCSALADGSTAPRAPRSCSA